MTNQLPLDPAVPNEPPLLSPDEFVLELRKLMSRVALPDISNPGPRPFRRRLAHVDPLFLQAAINATGNSTAVQGALGSTDEDLRKGIDYSGRWSAVTDELRGMLRTVMTVNVVLRQRLGLTALKTYKICQQLVRDSNDVQLTEHVREMRRLNKFGRARRRPSSNEPPLDPVVKTP